MRTGAGLRGTDRIVPSAGSQYRNSRGEIGKENLGLSSKGPVTSLRRGQSAANVAVGGEAVGDKAVGDEVAADGGVEVQGVVDEAWRAWRAW